MYSFTAQQRFTALVWLSLFHIAIITSSNYLVQLPITVFGFHTTWGAFTFPFIFLATDLTVRIFGAPLARRIILAVMVPALFISYVISTVTYQESGRDSRRWAVLTCSWRASPSPALWPTCSARSSTFTSSTACASAAPGG